MDSCPENKPCHATLYGAFLLAYGLYIAAFSRVFLGESFSGALGKVFAGNVVNAEGLWFALLVGGIVLLFIGVRAARSHDDQVDSRSLFGSILLACICVLAVWDHWFFTDSALAWHACRGFWFSLMGFCGGNIWLETRGLFTRRRNRDDTAIEPSWFWFRRRTIEITEWSAGQDHAAPLPEFQRWQAPPAIGQSQALPQIVYVKQGDSFIPVRLADAPRVIEHRS
jgi:hypothetical protein